MKPKMALVYFSILVLIGTIVAARGAHIHSDLVVIVGFVFIFTAVVIHGIFYRCPHCKRYLDKSMGQYCPYCGERLDD